MEETTNTPGASITTRFDVNNLVQHKYATNQPTQEIYVFEIIEVQVIKCMGGTQVFYLCRPMQSAYTSEFSRNRKLIEFTPGFTREGTAYVKFREDELKACSPELEDLVKNPPPVPPSEESPAMGTEMTKEQRIKMLEARLKNLKENEGQKNEPG